ncbi:MAG: hypothetical protein M3R68_02615 [Acidobacteriota bacterium]|nr:hypothetical protein [Acidobacteriota bacterium]
MTTEPDQARALAERIARKVSAGGAAGLSHPNKPLDAEIAAVRASISDLQKRLVQLESRVHGEASRTAPAQRSFTTFVPPTHSPWLAGVNATVTHPTEERFGVEEAVVNELVDYFQSEKSCSIDPSGKPCDHCAMCSSRGF